MSPALPNPHPSCASCGCPAALLPFLPPLTLLLPPKYPSILLRCPWHCCSPLQLRSCIRRAKRQKSHMSHLAALPPEPSTASTTVLPDTLRFAEYLDAATVLLCAQ
ncbi:uncharacterized protein ZBAI_09931 [Zygosaccharomyces bailii ISA1307]|nr:uncharacterized protein ZBAI_09931 [Zygosaccharomyces bailii ISA1307]